MTSERVDVAVVGAGVTGLECVRQLRRRGVDVRCLERDDEPGGVIVSERRDGRVLDAGPQRLRATPLVEDLIGALGLADEVVGGDRELPIAVLRDGRLRRAPLGPRAFLTTDLLSLRGKLRFLGEPVTGAARPDETVRRFLARSFGWEAERCFLGPLYAGIYGSDPSRMPMRYSLGRLLEERGVGRSLLLWAARRWLAGAEVPPPLTFRDGVQRLPEAIYRDVEDAVRLGVAARAVRPRDGGDGYMVDTDDGTLVAERVVVAAAADDAAGLLGDLDAAAAGALDALTYNPVAVIHLDAAPEEELMGYQVALGEDTVTRGVTWNDALFGRDGVHTAFLGGALDPEAVAWSDDELAATAAEEFEAATGAPASAITVHRTRMPAFDESWSALDDLSLPDGIRIAGNYTGRAGIPGRIRQARRIAAELADDLATDADDDADTGNGPADRGAND